VEGRSVVLPLSREATQPGDAFGGEVGHELDLDRAGSVVAGDLELQQERSRVARPLESDGVLARGVARIRAGLSAPSRSPRVVPRDRASRQGSDQEQATGNRSQFVGEVGRSSERATARTGGCRGRSLGDGGLLRLRHSGRATVIACGAWGTHRPDRREFLSRLMGAGRRLEGAVDVAFVMRSRGRGLESALLALVLCRRDVRAGCPCGWRISSADRVAPGDGRLEPPRGPLGPALRSCRVAATPSMRPWPRPFAVGVAQPFSAGVGGGAFRAPASPRRDFRCPRRARSRAVGGEVDDVRRRGRRRRRVGPGPPGGGRPGLRSGYGRAPRKARNDDPGRGPRARDRAGRGRSRDRRLPRRNGGVHAITPLQGEFAETWRIQFAPFDPASMKGQRLVQRDLAATLRRLAAGGERVFRDGVVGRAIVAEVRRRGGLLTIEDMRRYEPVWRQPIVSEYRALRIVSFPPPSSGGGRSGAGLERARRVRPRGKNSRRSRVRSPRCGGHEARVRGSGRVHGGFRFRRRSDRSARVFGLRPAGSGLASIRRRRPGSSRRASSPTIPERRISRSPTEREAPSP
jgi:hypothetical protein